jgi:hypothetical protein
VRRQGTLSHELPVVRKNHQDTDGGIDNLRALNKLTIKDAQDMAAARNPGAFRERFCCLPHPSEQRSPRFLVYGEDEEDMKSMDAFVWSTVVLW